MSACASTLITGGFHVCTPAWKSADWSYADCHRLYLPRTGAAEFFVRGRAWTLRPGYVYLLPGRQFVRYRCKRRMTLDWIHFRPDEVETDLGLARFKRGLRWPARAWAFWKPGYTRMRECFAAHPPELEARIQAMLLWLYAELMRLPAWRSGLGDADAQRSLNALKPALEFMDRHYAENPALDAVAARVHLAPEYFHRCFRRTFHITPHTYLLGKRMRMGWELLREGRTVKEASEQLHFGSPFYFSRAFKRYFGTPPVQVRIGKTPRAP
ncbi:MAG: helix-turn-helix transcriptional regulator [Planctomycetes bacterium]|nr:helix-turn-helix transcriptional regulator [Planctomycetota bacterium]